MKKRFALAVGFWLLVGMVPAASARDGASIRPEELRCESLVDPRGIGVVTPRLSWALAATPPAGRGLAQSAYQVEVASSAAGLAAGHGDLWDSGRVGSPACVNVVYAGVPLRSLAACYWRVRVWDRAGQPSAWSEPATWSVGLLTPDDWQGGRWIGRAGGTMAGLAAKWIWYPEGNPASSAPVATRYFRRSFTLPADRRVASASLAFTADNEATVSVNGGPAGSEADFHELRRADVTAALRPGENVLSATVRNTGDKPNPAGFTARLAVTFADGGDAVVVATDAGWHAATAPGQGWDAAGFDDASWVPAKELGPVGMGPWGEPGSNDRTLPARQLRKPFTADKPLRRATVCYCGLGWSELYINGSKVGTEVLSPPLSDYAKRLYYVTHDVTSLVRPGANAMGAWLGNGRFFAPRLSVPAGTRTFGLPELRLRLHLAYADGTAADVFSDPTWTATTDGPITANNEYDGESYDARKEAADWAKPGFDDAKWRPADVMPAPAGDLCATMIDPTRVVQSIKPVSVRQAKPGAFVFDLGQNFAGWCKLTVQGRRGTVVTMRFAERLNPDGTLNVANLRSAKATDAYTLRGDAPEVYEPRFTLHGFQYVEVTGYPGTPTASAIEGEVVRDDMASAGDFTCSNPLLNHIYRDIVWTTGSSYRSIVTDCCQRDERQGWLGDRNEESRGESYVLRNGPLYAKWAQDMADSQRPDGQVSDVCPAYWEFFTNSVTWPSTMVIVPGMLMDQDADASVARRLYPNMDRWMGQMAGHIAADGTLSKDSYGDWCSAPSDAHAPYGAFHQQSTSGTLIATSYFHHCATLMARYARTLGKADDAARYDAIAARTLKGLNARFFKPDAARYDIGSQISFALPLAFDMVPGDQAQRVADRLADSIARETHGHIATGLIGCQWINTALATHGHADVAYQMATQTTYPSLGYMVDHGATTIWELWNGNTAGPAMNSGNHMMLVGDLCTFLYEDLAGIRPDPERPGFQHVIMRPDPVPGLTAASGTHRSPYGLVASAWSTKGGAFHWDVTVPPNTTASLFVPAKSAADVTESGGPAEHADGLTFVAERNGRAEFTATSGEYHLSVR
jgi:alpha-L-rhamnosidase